MPRITFVMDTLKVIDGSEVNHDEPYLWVYWIRVDSETFFASNRQFVTTIPNPGHGNISTSGIDEGQSVQIPPEVGTRTLDLRPILGAIGLAGVMVFAWEQDYTPNWRVKKAYKEVAEILNSFVDEAVKAATLSIGTMPPDIAVSAFVASNLPHLNANIKKRVRKLYIAVRDNDDFIGADLLRVFLNEVPILSKPFVLDFKGAGAHYRIRGSYGMFFQRANAFRAIRLSGRSQESLFSVFEQGGIYRSDDGLNPGGDGNTELVYGPGQRVLELVGYRGEVITAFEGGGIYRSPSGRFLGGGGSSVLVYGGNERVVAMTPFAGGILTAFEGRRIYLSPDGNNLGGGGSTEVVYSGSQKVVSMIPFGKGVITAFSGKGIYRSPDGRHLGGGGNTVLVYSGNQNLQAIAPFRDGVIAAFEDGTIFHSPDGNNLGGDGGTTLVYPPLA